MDQQVLHILDLQPKNSFIKWAADQGYTVFVVSWVNPDRRLAAKTFEDYMREGIFGALDAIEKATGEREINAIGYCIGGTLLGATLASMAQTNDDRVKSQRPSLRRRSISARPAICRSSSTTINSNRSKSA